jgi:hypothetical protein
VAGGEVGAAEGEDDPIGDGAADGAGGADDAGDAGDAPALGRLGAALITGVNFSRTPFREMLST